MYATIDDISALIPHQWIINSTDDNADGSMDAIAQVLGLAEDEVNAFLSARYYIPITPANEGVAAFLRLCTSHIAAAMMYARRKKPEQYPHATALDALRARLLNIANGAEPLNPSIKMELQTALIEDQPSRLSTRRMGL
jgi:phage gp36-like protein